jgi:uncharacterized phage-associated protein
LSISERGFVVEERFDARGIANLILDRTDGAGLAITNMAINKLIYFAHAWFLATFQRPLVIQQFEAWQHGPLVQDVYHSFKKYGDRPIRDRAEKLDRETVQYVKCEVDVRGNDLELLHRVIDNYATIPATKLRAMTHVSGGPWDRVWNYEGHSNPGMVIPDDMIAEYFSARFLSYGELYADPQSTQSSSFCPLRQQRSGRAIQ